MEHHLFKELSREIEYNELKDVMFFNSALWLNCGKYSLKFTVLLTPTENFREIKEMLARYSTNKDKKMAVCVNIVSQISYGT